MNLLKKYFVAVVITAALLLSGCGSGESYFDKAQKELENGNFEDAYDNYNKAIMEDQELGMSYRGAGICSFMEGDYGKAEEFFVRSLQESKGIVGDVEMDLSYYLAECYVCQGKNDEALEVYSNILDYDNSQNDARLYRGILYVSKGETDKAKKDFKMAADENSDSISYYYHIYQSLAGCQDEDAQDYLQKGLACKGDSAEDIYMKACLYNASGDTESALELLLKSKKEGYGKASFLMGQIYENRGDLASAISNYDDYIKVSNVSVPEYVQIINCRIKSGDKDGAKADCEKAVTNAAPSQLQSMKFEQIVALEKMGEFEEAKEKMVQYLSAYPDDEKALRESEFLQTR